MSKKINKNGFHNECRATIHRRRTGKYIDRTFYDTPSSIRGCLCQDCVKMRRIHHAKAKNKS